MIKLFTWRSKLRLSDSWYYYKNAGGSTYTTRRGVAVGLLYNPGALWVGAHYSQHNKRWCINIVPCLTVWYTNGGCEP